MLPSAPLQYGVRTSPGFQPALFGKDEVERYDRLGFALISSSAAASALVAKRRSEAAPRDCVRRSIGGRGGGRACVHSLPKVVIGTIILQSPPGLSRLAALA